MSEEEIVDRAIFNEKMVEFYANHNQSNRSIWSRSDLEYAIKILSEIDSGVTKTANHYHYQKHYYLAKIGSVTRVCVKKKKKNDKPETEQSSLIYMIPFEEYYDKLKDAHIACGHGGRDRTHYQAGAKWKISKKSCGIFVSLCRTCSRKKGFARKNLVVKPITTDGFNMRCQIDLVDFQSCPDGKIIQSYFYHYYLLCRVIITGDARLSVLLKLLLLLLLLILLLL